MFKESDDEIWKDIDGFEGLYAVSTKGRVRNLKRGRILTGGYNKDGYKLITLKGKTYTIHKLVALAFLDNPHNLPQVDHIDENKGNNDVSNLRWVTISENIRHSIHHLSCQIKQITKDGELIKVWESSIQIKKETGYDASYIISCCKGKRRSAYGYCWGYVDTNSQRVMNRPVAVYKGNDYIGEFPSAKKACKALGLKYKSVNKCLSGRIPSNKGFTFKYAE